MSRAHDSRESDPAKKRREYLAKKISASTLVIISVIIALTLGFAAVVLICAFFQNGGRLKAGEIYFVSLPVVLLVLSLYVGRLSALASKEAAALPIVPPVRKQIASLPADEVLLRGSDQPAAANCELLRAAQEGLETPSEELLRAENRTI